MIRPWSRDLVFEHNVLCIDIVELNARGAMEIGRVSELQRGYPDGCHEEIQVERYPESLNTHHVVYDSEGQEISTYGENFDIVQTQQKFGGTRDWFVCAGCQKKKRKLYYKSFGRCRECLGLRYICQHESKVEQKLRQIKKLEQRVITYGEIPVRYYARPKGMHCRTYDMLIQKINFLWEEYDAIAHRMITQMEQEMIRFKVMANNPPTRHKVKKQRATPKK